MGAGAGHLHIGNNGVVGVHNVVVCVGHAVRAVALFGGELVTDRSDPVFDAKSRPVDKVAQEIWQTYVAEVGRSLPPGLADKLAQAAIDALSAVRHEPSITIELGETKAEWVGDD